MLGPGGRSGDSGTWLRSAHVPLTGLVRLPSQRRHGVLQSPEGAHFTGSSAWSVARGRSAMRATQFERHTPATRATVLSLGDPDSFDARPAGPAVPRGVVPDLGDALHDFIG